MNGKRLLLHYIVITALALTYTAVLAQTGSTARLYCHAVGSSQSEPLGDREGHSINDGQVTCRIEGGPADGSILTGINIIEWDKGNGVLLSGAGVTRKPGATTAYQHSEGKITLTMTDGKVTGSTASGRGRFTMATGSASALNGKTYSFTAKTVGPGQTVVDVKYD